MRGTVSRYNEFRGYGFITGDDDETYFVHYSGIVGDGHKYLRIGDVVKFDPLDVPKGHRAENVQLIQSKLSAGHKLKANPFTPQQPMTDPHRFAGRDEAIVNAVDCLFNNKNVLITGERGIGKSSVAFQLAFLAEGETTLLERLSINTEDFRFAYLTADHRCIPGHDLGDIVESLIVSAIRKLGVSLDYAKVTTELGIDLKFIRALQKAETTEEKAQELVTYCVDSIARIWDRANGRFNGICLLIDEIDCLPEQTNLAAFLKAVVESLHFKNYPNICFVLAGVTGVVTDLLTQHKSFSRLFENLQLRRMTESELAEIIGKALHDSGTHIESDAKAKIISLSDRFPEPIHLLGYHSFRYDSDGNIDDTDLERALHFVIRELKRQEFDTLYGKSREGLSSVILHSLSATRKRLVSISEISAELGEAENKVSGAMGDLVSKSVIVRERSGFFRLKDPLFKIYLRWVLGDERQPSRSQWSHADRARESDGHNRSG